VLRDDNANAKTGSDNDDNDDNKNKKNNKNNCGSWQPADHKVHSRQQCNTFLHVCLVYKQRGEKEFAALVFL
jgi:hypothetical protein